MGGLLGGLVAAGLLVGSCSSGTSLPVSAPTAREPAASTVDPPSPSPALVPRSSLWGSSDPPCTLGATEQACHGWTNTIVDGGSVAFTTGGSAPIPDGSSGPFLQSMTCTYNVPDVPTQAAAGTPATVLYLYCQIVASDPNQAVVQAFGQLAPQIALGSNFDPCGQVRPSGPLQWYMQAMYFWRSPDGTGQCVGGTIYPVAVGAQVTSTIDWDAANGWWELSITDGANTSSQTVEAPSSPSGENATMSWSDVAAVVPGGSFEMWNGVETGSYPSDAWTMATMFEALPNASTTPFPPMVPVTTESPTKTDSNATTVTCTPDSVCTWAPP